MLKNSILLAVFLLAAISAAAQNRIETTILPARLENSPRLQKIVDKASAKALNDFSAKGLREEKLAVTLIDLSEINDKSASLPSGSFRGDQPMYPASVVKMFYLTALQNQISKGKIVETAEIKRAMHNMIVDSSDDATHFVVDVLTGTSGGAELSPRELARFAEKRNFVNRYFQSLGYNGINVAQKTYCDDIYGRERQFWNEGRNRNKLTTDTTARLLSEIALGNAISPNDSAKMLELMRRNYTKKMPEGESQDTSFSGIALKDEKNARLFSKAGWTSTARHDAALIETTDGLRFVIVVFTENAATEREIIPSIVKTVLTELRRR